VNGEVHRVTGSRAIERADDTQPDGTRCRGIDFVTPRKAPGAAIDADPVQDAQSQTRGLRLSSDRPSRSNRRGFSLLAVSGAQLPVRRIANDAVLRVSGSRITRDRLRKANLPSSSAEAGEGLGGTRFSSRIHGRRGWPPEGSPDSRTTHEEPSRPCRQARHEDGPAASACQLRTLSERAALLSSGHS